MLRTFKSMAKDGREFPPEKCQKTCRSWSSERDFAHRMELDPELSFFVGGGDRQSGVDAHESVRVWLVLWDIAKINGCDWKPQDSVQKKWLQLSQPIARFKRAMTRISAMKGTSNTST